MPLIKILGGGLNALGEWTTRPSTNITTVSGAIAAAESVARLSDATGHGRSMAQATEASQPTLDAEAAVGNFMVRFGSGQYLSAEIPDRQIVDIWVDIDIPANISGDFIILARDADTTTTDKLLLEGGAGSLLLEGGAGALLLESGTTKAAFELRLNEDNVAAATGGSFLIGGSDQLLINGADQVLI